MRHSHNHGAATGTHSPLAPSTTSPFAAQGLNPERIAVHAARVQGALAHAGSATLEIAEACTTANGGIIPADLLQSLQLDTAAFADWAVDNLVTLIPAGGEASRYTHDLVRFVKEYAPQAPSIAQGMVNCPEVPTSLQALVPFVRNVKHGPLRKRFLERRDEALQSLDDDFISIESPGGRGIANRNSRAPFSPEQQQVLPFLDTLAACEAVLDVLGPLPKALVPAVIEGNSFLELKHLEQRALFPASTSAVVAPAGRVDDFTHHLSHCGAENWLILEQSRALSTIRFHPDGSPLHDAHGAVVPVAGGHGELLHLFPQLLQHRPGARCVHIRNIDNVVGHQEEVKQEIRQLGAFFTLLFNTLQAARRLVDDQANPPDSPPQQQDLDALGPLLANREPHASLEWVIHSRLQPLFSWPSLSEDHQASRPLLRKTLRALLSRPLSVFGVVPKKTGDVGGGPVFILPPPHAGEGEAHEGAPIKICLEMPHASPAQRQEYFGEQGLCSHFNPVCSFFELQTQGVSQLFDDRFWLLTRRSYQGHEVCYHETVLYELIGNSAQTNLVFVEISRNLFHPHKTIFDGMGAGLHERGF